MAFTLTRNVTIATNESRNTLGAKLSQLVDLSTFSNLDASNSSTNVQVPQSSSGTPTAQDNRVWQYTASNTMLAVYGGSSSQKRWEPAGPGCNLKNGTGGARSASDVVCLSSSSANLTADSFCTTGNIIVGSYQEGPSSAVFGMMKSFGKVRLAASGAIARGDYVKANTAGSTYQVVTATTVVDGACGIALSAASGGFVDVLMFGHNKT